MRAALLFLALAASSAPARAADDAPVATPAGKEVRLGAYATFKRDCSGGAAAEVRPAGDQRGGVLVITSGALSTARVPGCATVTAPAHILVYRPNPGFAGVDRVTYDVVDPATGSRQTHRVAVTVGP